MDETTEKLQAERDKAQASYESALASFQRYSRLKGVPRKSVMSAAGIPLAWKRIVEDIDARLAALRSGEATNG